MSIFKKRKGDSTDSLKSDSHIKKNRLKLALSHGMSLKNIYESNSDWASHYRKQNYIADLVYFSYVDKTMNPSTIQKITGHTEPSVKAIVDEFIASLEKLATNSPEEALKGVRAVFGAKNPLLYLIHFYNATKRTFFDCQISELFAKSDYNYPKTLNLLRRNLVLTTPQRRESIQNKFQIDTKDLKFSKKNEVLYFCQSCMNENWISLSSHNEDPVSSCKCGKVITASRHMIGYKAAKGIVFKCGTKQVHTIDNGRVIKTDAKEFFDAELGGQCNDKKYRLTEYMLWHHDSDLKRCGCPECNS